VHGIDDFVSQRSQSVYQGGSLELFSQLTGANSSQVLYIGDHIFADITVSKKVQVYG
jgi:hypothetical protein